MRIGQVTIGASATPLFPAGTQNIYASVLTVQNNATHSVRLGDNTVSSTRGIQLTTSGANTVTIAVPHGTLVNSWYVAGTQNDVIDFLYELSQ